MLASVMKMMKYCSLWVLVGLLNVPFVAVAGQNTPESEILQLTEELGRAVKAGDDVVLDQLLSDNLVIYNAWGKERDKQGHLDIVRSGKLLVRSYDSAETNVRMYGDVAIVGEIINAEITWDGNVRDQETIRSTRVFAKEEGQWRVVHVQNTLIKGV